MNTKNILVLSPHTDDGEWGAGATINRFATEGYNVYYAAFSTCKQSLPKESPEDTLLLECEKATSELGINRVFFFDFQVRYFSYKRQEILEEMVKIKKEIDPWLVLLPCSTDFHQDHEVIHKEGIRAFKNANILGYELVWDTVTMHTSFFSKIEKKHLQKKIDALMCYKSQQFRNYHNEEFIKSLAITRGIQIGGQLAEAFEVIRWVI